jgi:hypothetical protein
MLVNRTYILNPELNPMQLVDAIMERCNKLQALTSLCQSEDLMEYTLELVQDYFWLQSGLIAELKELSEVFSKQVLASAYS